MSVLMKYGPIQTSSNVYKVNEKWLCKNILLKMFASKTGYKDKNNFLRLQKTFCSVSLYEIIFVSYCRDF